MRYLIFLLLSTSVLAQTVSVPSLPVSIPARVVPAQTVTFTVPASGKVTLTIPAQTLPVQTTSTPSIKLPVALGTITLNFSCTGPDLQHLACKATQQ